MAVAVARHGPRRPRSVPRAPAAARELPMQVWTCTQTWTCSLKPANMISARSPRGSAGRPPRHGCRAFAPAARSAASACVTAAHPGPRGQGDTRTLTKSAGRIQSTRSYFTPRTSCTAPLTLPHGCAFVAIRCDHCEVVVAALRQHCTRRRPHFWFHKQACSTRTAATLLAATARSLPVCRGSTPHRWAAGVTSAQHVAPLLTRAYATSVDRHPSIAH
jgi:hypothetical protein